MDDHMPPTTVSSLLSRDQILGASDLTYEVVSVPEWGGSVRVRTLTGTERDQFEASITTRKGKSVEMNLKNLRSRLVALCCVDVDGTRLFTSFDVDALGDKSGSALDRVYTVAAKLAGITEKDAEELAKNSESDLNEGSTSG